MKTSIDWGKNVTVTKSEARKTIEKFDKSKAADGLWKFVNAHPSCRVVFNALVKSGFVDLGAALPKVHDLLKKAKTSFVFSANCKNTKCGNVMDVPNIADSDFKLPDQKEINCPKCKLKNKISAKDYVPNYEPEIKDLVKLLHVGCKQGLLSPAHVFECYACGSIEPLREKAPVKFTCSKCKNFSHLSTQYVPTYNKEMELLISDGQGYWLEWYTHRMMAQEQKVDYGLKITTKGETIDADVVALKDGLKIIIECKDGSDETFITKLTTIKRLANYFILATTSGLSDKAARTAKALLKGKFILVSPDALERLPAIVKNLK